MSEIRLWYRNGLGVREDGEFLCLTDMWRAAGSDENKRPGQWLRLPGTRNSLNISAIQLWDYPTIR